MSFAWKRIRNQKFKTVLTIFSLVSILLLIAYGIQTSRATKIMVTENIEKYSRGTYDILVRPEGARTDIEKELKTVEENYIGDGEGGISIEEWERIKEHPDIEIAAPVASLGYFTSNTASIELPSLENPTHFEWEFFTSDGLNTYPLNHDNGVFYLQTIDTKELYSIQVFDDISKEHSPFSHSGTNILFPQNYNLLVAIDTESEELLTGLDFSDLYRDFTDKESVMIDNYAEYRDDAPIIPILQREEFNIPLSIEITASELDVSLTELYKKYGLEENESLAYELYSLEPEEIEEFEEFLLTLDRFNIKTYELDLTNYQSPFDGTHLILDENFNINFSEDGSGGSMYNDSGKYYTASAIDYLLKDDNIHVQTVKNGPPPQYREVKELGKSYLYDWEAPFMVWQMGTFKAKEKESELTSSPLGIYSTEDVTTTDGVKITPTITPGSFIAAPAAGVTTLESASLIKGDEPIDAIRIKLNNITSYNPEAQKRIEALATELSEEGYVVDIVAGSSFKTQHMYVEGIGEVTSPWTNLGVAEKLTNAWDTDSVISISLFSLFGLFWLFSYFSFERNRLHEENDILYFLGWNQRDIRKKNITEQFILVLLSIFISVGLALLLRFSFFSFLIIGLFVLISLVLIMIIFFRSSRTNTRAKEYRLLASIRYYKSLLLPTIVALLLAASVAQFQVASIYELWTGSTDTTLGNFVFTEGLYLRSLIVVATILLSIFVLIEAIQGIIYERRDEFGMYHVMGWTGKMIKFHFLKEVMIWVSLSLVLGTLLSVVVSFYLDLSIINILLGIAFSTIIYVIITFSLVVFRKYNLVLNERD